MTSPVIHALVNAKVSDMIDPPRSWGKAEKIAFLNLPHDLQAFYAKREKQRDQEVTRCQQGRAEAIRQLGVVEAKLQEALARIEALTKQLNHTEVKDGKSTQVAA